MGVIGPERTTAWVCGQRGCDNYGERARLICNRNGHGVEVPYVRADLHEGAVEALLKIAHEYAGESSTMRATAWHALEAMRATQAEMEAELKAKFEQYLQDQFKVEYKPEES